VSGDEAPAGTTWMAWLVRVRRKEWPCCWWRGTPRASRRGRQRTAARRSWERTVSRKAAMPELGYWHRLLSLVAHDVQVAVSKRQEQPVSLQEERHARVQRNLQVLRRRHCACAHGGSRRAGASEAAGLRPFRRTAAVLSRKAVDAAASWLTAWPMTTVVCCTYSSALAQNSKAPPATRAGANGAGAKRPSGTGRRRTAHPRPSSWRTKGRGDGGHPNQVARQPVHCPDDGVRLRDHVERDGHDGARVLQGRVAPAREGYATSRPAASGRAHTGVRLARPRHPYPG